MRCAAATKTTMLPRSSAVLDREHLRLNIVDREKLGALERVTFSVSASSARPSSVACRS